jgi:hypothetical protein
MVRTRQTWLESTINFAAVAHPVDAYEANLIANFINYTVITHPDAPIIFATGQLAATRRTRVLCQRLNGCNYTVMNNRRKPGEIFLSHTFQQDPVHGHLFLRVAR